VGTGGRLPFSRGDPHLPPKTSLLLEERSLLPGLTLILSPIKMRPTRVYFFHTAGSRRVEPRRGWSGDERPLSTGQGLEISI